MNRLVRIRTLLGLPFVASCLVFSATAFAATEEFKVFGCDGSPRAARSVSQGSLSSVEIRVSDLKTGAGVSGISFELQRLSNKSDSALGFTSQIVDGKGSFRDVAAGEWKVCPSSAASQAKDLSVTQVAIINSSEDESDKTAWLGAGGVVLSGLGFGILSGSGGSDSARPASSGNDSIPPVALGDDPVAQPLLPIENGGGGSFSSGDKVACAAAEDCLKGEKPTPLSPVL